MLENKEGKNREESGENLGNERDVTGNTTHPEILSDCTAVSDSDNNVSAGDERSGSGPGEQPYGIASESGSADSGGSAETSSSGQTAWDNPDAGVDPECNVCKNCDNRFKGKYCNCCGQEADTRRLTVGILLKDITKAFTSYDHGLRFSLRMVLMSPGKMIRDYVAGRRMSYSRPFSLLAILCLVYVFCATVRTAYVDGIDSLLQPPQYDTIDWDDVVTETDDDNLSIRFGNKDKVDAPQQQEQTVSSAATDTLSTPRAIPPEDAASHAETNRGSNTHYLLKLFELIWHWFNGKLDFLVPFLTLPLYALSFRRMLRRRGARAFNFAEALFVAVILACQRVVVNIIVTPMECFWPENDNVELIRYCLYWAMMIWTFRDLLFLQWKTAVWKGLTVPLYAVVLLILLALIITTLVILVLFILARFGLVR